MTWISNVLKQNGLRISEQKQGLNSKPNNQLLIMTLIKFFINLKLF